MSASFHLTGDRTIERGAAYSWSFDLNTSTGEFPISGYAISGWIQRKWDKNPETTWTSEILSTGSGLVNMSLTALQTENLSLAPLEHQVYIYPPNSGTLRIIKGDVDVDGGLTIY